MAIALHETKCRLFTSVKEIARGIENLNSFCSEVNCTEPLKKVIMPPSLTKETGDMNLTQTLLLYLDECSEFNTLEYAKMMNADHQKVIGAMKSLQANEGVCFLEFVFFFLNCSNSYLCMS